MNSKFKNDSSIKSIAGASDVKCSQKGEEQIAIMSDQIKYWQCNPDKYIEFVTGIKLLWYQKVWVKLCLKKEWK